MANFAFLKLTTEKNGAISDPMQLKPEFSQQILITRFEQNISMAVNAQGVQGGTGSIAKPAPIKFRTHMGSYEAELKQACLTGDNITEATFSFPILDKTGVQKTVYVIKATGGIVCSVKRVLPDAHDSDNASKPVRVEVEISYEKLEEQDTVHNKQMSYDWGTI
ncbi:MULTISPECIES: type VI secretion system tube protein Hcp [unclassified Francisella]|uniref:type VI secretion system tube protein Hcp n=1 Tax=unclassified Francisella TaxID=2610885 RepID=UPI002E2FD018|nr:MULTISPECIES: type VI secretion system tube protein Hcp [unclassified Francisella]MED7818332.1 type VI secretion system tube protein Hcp [Francisella sp. 19S2-4]MED7829168.1 type VI secretion system tube protein Hcp [Francisella sp. 19S2-10]